MQSLFGFLNLVPPASQNKIKFASLSFTAFSVRLAITSLAFTAVTWNGSSYAGVDNAPGIGVAPVGAKTVQCPSILQQNVARLQDEKELSLCQFSGQVVLVVNTASYCGFTPQYKALEALYDQYKSKGLVVLGFPSNDFSQEPDSNGQIADFCENTFGVKFPMFTKTSVKGSSASPLFKQLAQRTQTTPKWNFYKYLISRDGQTIKSFNSMTSPDEKGFLTEVQKQLAVPAL
jgi:glutathione peroxidase